MKPKPHDESRPLLALSMIVKDEARSIGRTLASVRPFIDRWAIVDTGSTDETREIVRSEMASLPGELTEAPFVDFATTRNLALDRCGDRTELVLWLDADDELFGGEELRSFLMGERAASGPDRDAYLLCVDAGVSFYSARIVRSRSGFRFRGAVHEVLAHPTKPPPSRKVPGSKILHRPESDGIARTHARRERDLQLLRQALAKDPADARAAFYLAMTYLWLARFAEASAAFARRIELGGFAEEVYLSKMGLAEAAQGLGEPWSAVLERYLDAHAFAPQRAEPLHRIALHYNAQGQHALCLLFARRALDIPYPERDVHFIDRDVYTWRLHDLVGSSAYWLGEYELGERSARIALSQRPGDARLARNLEFYEKRKRA